MARRKKYSEPRCCWTVAMDCDCEKWETDCGEAFVFMVDGPKENGTRFCCYCGRPLKVVGKPQAVDAVAVTLK